MRQRVGTCFLWGCLWTGFAINAALPQPGNHPYMVTHHVVAPTRQEAIVQAQRAAWDKLVNQHVPRQARPQARTSASIENLLDSYQIDQEKSASGRYEAVITFAFSPQHVRSFLQKAQVPFSEALPGPTLIVPVRLKNNRFAVWETERNDHSNLWLEAWQNAQHTAHSDLWSIIVPLGDGTDSSLLPDGSWSTLEEAREALQRLAHHYGATSVLVVQLPDATDTQRPIQVFPFFFDNHPMPTKILINVPYLPRPDSYSQIVRAVLSSLEDSWQSQQPYPIFRGSALVPTQVSFDISSAEKLTLTLQNIAAIPGVVRVVPHTLMPTEATYSVFYNGGTTPLDAALASHHLRPRNIGP